MQLTAKETAVIAYAQSRTRCLFGLVDALGLSWTAAVVNPGLVLHPPPKDCSRQSALSIRLRADFQEEERTHWDLFGT